MEDYSLLSEKQKNQVQSYNIKLIDGLNVSNLYNFLRKSPEYEILKKNFAAFLGSLWAQNRNKQFHESLNIFEKLGFLSKIKEKTHYQKVGIERDLVEIAVLAFTNLVPHIIQTYSRKKEANKVIEFVTAALAYVNQEATPLIQARVQFYYRIWNQEFTPDKFRSIFDKYVVDRFPDFPQIPDSLYKQRHTVFQTIISATDLKDPKVVQRASELGEFLGESSIDIEEAIKNTEENLELFSDKTTFERLTLGNLFKDIVSDVIYLKQASDYTGSYDPFKNVREQRKKIVVKGSVGLTLAGLTFFTGPVGDMIIAASAPVINNLINKELDVDTALEIHRRFKALREDLSKFKEEKDGERKSNQEETV